MNVKMNKQIIFIVAICLAIIFSGTSYAATRYPPIPGDSLLISDVFNTPNTGGGESAMPGVTDDGKALVITNSTNQGGAIWSKESIDITQPFETEAYIYFGNEKAKSGDGITFSLIEKTASDFWGLSGQGLGIYGKNMNSDNYNPEGLTIEMDTYVNDESGGLDSNLPNSSNHVAMVSRQSADNLFLDQWKPLNHLGVTYTGTGYLSDGCWKNFHVKWEPINNSKTGTLSYTLTWLDGSGKVMSASQSFTTKAAEFLWGFTGSTGGQASDNIIAMKKLPDSPVVSQTIKVTTADGTVVDDDNPANVGDTLTVEVENIKHSGDDWTDVTTTVDASAFGDAIKYVEGSNLGIGDPTIKSNQWEFPSAESVDNTQSFTFEITAANAKVDLSPLLAKAIGGNGIAESSTSFGIEEAAITGKQSIDILKDDQSLDKLTPGDEITITINNHIEGNFNKIAQTILYLGNNQQYFEYIQGSAKLNNQPIELDTVEDYPQQISFPDKEIEAEQNYTVNFKVHNVTPNEYEGKVTASYTIDGEAKPLTSSEKSVTISAGILQLTVPNNLDFGAYQLASEDTILSWPENSPVAVMDNREAKPAWQLRVRATDNIANYLYYDNQLIGESKQIIESGNSTDGINYPISSDWSDNLGIHLQFKRTDSLGIGTLSGTIQWEITSDEVVE